MADLGVYRKMAWSRGRRSPRTGLVVLVVGLCVVGAAFAGGTLTGRALAGADAVDTVDATEAPHASEAVFVYGDSLVVQSEPYLGPVAGAFGLKVTAHAFGGIAPCDALGWLADDLRKTRPHVVVFAFSGNSLSDCMRDESGQLLTGDDLLAKYRADVEAAASMVTHAGVPFVLASPPASEVSRNWEQLDSLYREIAAARAPFVQYTDAGAQIAPDGTFAPTQRCLPFELTIAQSKDSCVSDGGSIDVRAPDGVHFCSDPSAATANASSCTAYSSGALRYAIALVTAAKLDLDYLATLSTISRAAAP